MTSNSEIHLTLYASLLAALTAAGAYLAIPIGPVPIVLQNLFVMLTGILPGPRWGTASVSVYLLAGLCGLPVFAGGTGGVGRLFGPTGGYLMGFVPAVFITGWLSEKGRHRVDGLFACADRWSYSHRVEGGLGPLMGRRR